MAGSQTLRFDIVGDAASAARAFRQTADGAALAARGAKQLSDSLAVQSKSAQVSAQATLALAKSDDILRDAELELSGAADEASKQLRQQGRDAEESAAKTRLAGAAASGAASGFGALGTPLGAAVAAGVALSPVLVTVGFGMAGLAAAAAGTVGPILQAGTATAAQQKALEGLDPAQRAAYNSLTALKGEFSGFSKSLEPEVLGLFNAGLSTASGLLHDVQPVASATGKALEGVLGQVDAEFRSGTWQKFFGFMAAEAGPDIQQLGGLFVALLDDLPPLLTALQPIATSFLGIATDAARAVGALEHFEGLARQANQLAEQSQKSGGSDPFSLGAIAGDAKNAGEQLLNSLFPGFTKTADVATKFAKSQGDAAAAGARHAEAIQKTAAAAADAAPKVGTLAGDVALLDTSSTNAATALNAYSDAWAKIVGNSLSDQQAVLAAEASFTSLTTAVKNSGGQSLAARQAFVSYVQQVGAGISTLEQNGASVAAVNAEYETNIQRLQSLHGLTPVQQADVQGLIKDYDLWANSTAGLSRQVLGAASAIGSNFEGELAGLGKNIPGISAAVSQFADAILKSGDSSSATAGDRAALIGDLHQAGISADGARALVQALQAQIDALKGKVVPISVQISEAITNQVAAGGATNAIRNALAAGGFAAGGLVQAAAGMLVTGGTPGRDSVLIRAMPGEVVVPTAMVKAGAVDHLRGQLPGFAAGGPVVPAQYQPHSTGSTAGGTVSRRLSADAQAIVAALEANTDAVLRQGPAVARSLNSVSAAAASRGSYSTRR